MGELRDAVGEVASRVTSANISQLPAASWSEILPSNPNAGIYLMSVVPVYEYGAMQRTHATASRADIGLGIALTKNQLDAIEANKPTSALMIVLDAVRAYIEARAADGTWRSTASGMAVYVQSGPMAYLEESRMGILELTIVIEGFQE